MDAEPPKVIDMGEVEFESFLLECRHVTWPNEALLKAANGMISDLDPSDPEYFEKRIVEKERKRQILYSLPDEFAAHRLKKARDRQIERNKREIIRNAGLSREEKKRELEEKIQQGVESGNYKELSMDDIILEAKKSIGEAPFDSDEDKIRMLKKYLHEDE